MRALQLLLLGTAVLVTACGGGGNGTTTSSSGGSSSGSPTSSSSGSSSSSSSSSSGGSSSSSSGAATVVSGYFNGTYTRSSSSGGTAGIYLDHAGRGQAVQYVNGQAVAVIPLGPILPGSHTYTSTAYAVNASTLDNGGTSESVSAELTGNAAATLSGAYSDGGGVNGNISTSYVSNTPANSLASIAGTYAFGYSIQGQSYTGTITINSGGGVSGSDSAGCSYSGTISGPPADNVFDLTFSTGCLNGSLSGVLYAPGNASLLSLAVNNSSGALFETLTKQ